MYFKNSRKVRPFLQLIKLYTCTKNRMKTELGSCLLKIIRIFAVDKTEQLYKKIE